MVDAERKKLYINASKAAAVVSAIAALMSVAIATWQIKSDLKKVQIRDWQNTVVFSILRQAPLDGLTFEEIQSRYEQAARDYKEELPRETIQTPALTNAILGLLAQHAITVRSDGTKYGVAFDTIPPSATAALIRNQMMNDAIDYISLKVHDSPGITEAELIRDVRITYPVFSEQNITTLISRGISTNNLIRGADGKLYLFGMGPKR